MKKLLSLDLLCVRYVEQMESSNYPRRAAAPFTALLMSLCLVSGCASAAKDIAASATPTVVHSGLHEANTPDNQQQLQHLLDSPAIQNVGENIGKGVGIGLFNQANQLTGGGAAVATGATDANSAVPTTDPTSGPSDATSQPVAGATSRPNNVPAGSTPAAKTPGAAAVAGFAGGGGLGSFVNSSVNEAFLAATNPKFKEGERAMSESIGEGFVSGMITVLNKEGPALGDTIRRTVGPIMQDLIREQIAPALHDMLQQQLAPLALQVWKEGAVETLKLTVRPDLQPDVMQNAENASVGASRGTHRAMIESGVLTPSGDLSPHIRLYLGIIIVAVCLMVVALLSLVVMLNLLVLHHWRKRNQSRVAAA